MPDWFCPEHRTGLCFIEGLENKEWHFPRQWRAMPGTNHRASYKAPFGKTSNGDTSETAFWWITQQIQQITLKTLYRRKVSATIVWSPKLRRNSTQSGSVSALVRHRSTKTSAGTLRDGVCQTQLQMSENTISERVKPNIYIRGGNITSTQFVTQLKFASCCLQMVNFDTTKTFWTTQALHVFQSHALSYKSTRLNIVLCWV